MKKTVHFVHFSSKPGGIEVLLPVIMNNMPAYDFKGYVLRKKVPGADIYDSAGIPASYGSNRNIPALIKAFRYFRKHRNDIFHAYNIGPLFLLILHYAGVKKIVYSIHGTIYWRSRAQRIRNSFLWKIALKKSIKLTSNSEFSRDVFLRKINNSSDIQVVYNPVDGRMFTPGNQKKKDANVRIIYVGRLCKGKNLSMWIELASSVREKLPETVFELYGSGPLTDSLNKQISDQDAGDYIFIKGFLKDIPEAYRKAAILLFLSEYESFGNVVVESILCGTPVLVSDIPSMREIFKDYNGFILKKDHVIRDVLIDKLKNPEKLRIMTAAAREQFLERFSTERHITAIDSIYLSLYG